MDNDELEALAVRVEAARKEKRLSYRQLAVETGVSFSTLARVCGGKGRPNRECERLMRLWLGEPVSHIIPAEMERLAQTLGREIARSFSAEITGMIAAALRAMKGQADE